MYYKRFNYGTQEKETYHVGFLTERSIIFVVRDAYEIQTAEDIRDALCPIFKFPMKRERSYMANAIESVNSTYKKLNCQRSVFPS